MRHWLAATAIVVLSVGCFPRSDVPLYCDPQTPCEGPEPLFCDLDGLYQEHCNTCIDKPVGACEVDSECSSESPICGDVDTVDCDGSPAVARECRACASGASGDAECAAKDGALPLCESGACVECRESSDCTADGARPVCDTAANSCVGCTEGGDCASDVCDTGSGSCVDSADIVYVATTGTDGASCGSQAMPCETIGGGQGGLAKVTAGRNIVKLGTGTYGEAVAVSGLEVELIGPATINPPLDDQAALAVTASSDVSLREIALTGATGNVNADGLQCQTSTVTVIESDITENADIGVQADGCTLTIAQSTISQNAEGGLDISSSSFDIQNNFIVSNGTSGAVGSGFGGVQVLGATQAGDILSFNTLADNRAINGAGGSAIDCQAPTQGTLSGNIIFSNLGTQLRANCNLTYSNVEGGAAGTGNIDMDPMFVNPAQSNFHLQAGSPCIDMADPAATLAIDVDGDARPQGARHDIGADEVAP